MNVAPSEEFVLHCDVAGCPSQLSMVAGVSRSLHGWGRVSVYGGTADDDGGVTVETDDYDLCSDHYRAVLAVLLPKRR